MNSLSFDEKYIGFKEDNLTVPFIPLKLVKSNTKNRNFKSHNDFFRKFGYTRESFSTKLGSIINGEIKGLSIENSDSLLLKGNIHIRDGKYTTFKKKVKDDSEMKQYCDFINDLHFIKERVGNSVKCRINKVGNARFFIDSNKKVTMNNIKSHLSRVMLQSKRKLNKLNDDINNLENSISEMELKLYSKQQNNEQLMKKIEAFALRKNNIFNALKDYFERKESSIYNKVMNYLNKSKQVEQNKELDEKNVPQKHNSSDEAKETKNIYVLPNSQSKQDIKRSIEEILQESSQKQLKKNSLTEENDNLNKNYTNAKSDEEVLNYVIDKINQNSSSVFQIMKYRKQIIKDLKMYGFELVTT